MNRKGFLIGMLSLASIIYAEDAAEEGELAYNNSKRSSASRSSNIEQRLCDLEKIFKKPKNFQPTNIDDRGVVEIEGEFLYWRFFNNGMPAGLYVDEVVSTPGGAVSTEPSNMKELYVKGHHAPGFRIGAGYTIPYGEWNLNSTWTRAHNLQKGPSKSPDGSSLGSQVFLYWQPMPYIYYIPSSGSSPVTLDRLKMNLRYDVVDLLLSRMFTLNSVFALTPAIGMQADIIKQTERIKANGTFDGPDGSESTGTFILDTRLRNHFSGIGLKGGTNLRMILKYGVEVYGNIFFSILSGEYDVSYSNTINVSSTSADPVITGSYTVYAQNKFKLPLTELDFSIGLKWGHKFVKESYIDLHIGYEQRQMINFNHLSYYKINRGNVEDAALNYNNPGDLLLHGLVVGGKLFF